MGRVNLNLFLSLHNSAKRVGDPKMGITSQGYPTSTFSVYRKENINLSIVAVGRTFEHFVDVGSVVADAGLVVGRARAVRKPVLRHVYGHVAVRVLDPFK